MNNLQTSIYGTGTMNINGQIKFVCTFLNLYTLWDIDVFSIKNIEEHNDQTKEIKYFLIKYFSPENSLFKKKSMMRHSM